MGRIVVSEFVSVDGIVEGPGGGEQYDRQGWAFDFDRGEEGDKFKLDEVMAADALLLGRVTYGGFAAAWPEREGDFADKFNSMPKYVVSTTLANPEWNNTTVIADNVVEQLAKLKDSHEEILLNGSPTLVRTLLDNDLVDEYRLMVFPVVLGHGKRLFPDGPTVGALELVDSKPAGETLILTYHPKR